MTDVGVIPIDHDLTAAGNIQMADAFEVAATGGVWFVIGGLPSFV